MKHFGLAMVLTLASVANVPQTQAATPSGQDQPAEQRVIRDPVEYNAYITALNTQDPVQKAAAMEAFVQQYPKSVVLTDALEQAMAAYQQAGNQGKVTDTARRIVQLAPDNVRTLAILVALDRAKATTSPEDSEALKESCTNAQIGLQRLPDWQRLDGVSEADFEMLHSQVANIFNGALGFCALQNKDYTTARSLYEKTFDPTDLQGTYQLAVADLEMNPIDVNGFWYGAKAISLAAGNPESQAMISKYIKARYKQYHGKLDDWDEFAATVASQSSLPVDMAPLITPVSTHCAPPRFPLEIPEKLSYGDMEYVLSQADCSPVNKVAADKVWQSIQDMEKNGRARLEIPVKVIAATTHTIDAAMSDENQAANKADVHVELEKPLARPLAAGTMIKIIGVITQYTPDPFMFTMEQGALRENTGVDTLRRPAAMQKP